MKGMKKLKNPRSYTNVLALSLSMIIVFIAAQPIVCAADNRTSNITIEDAVKIGLTNNPLIKQLNNEIELAAAKKTSVENLSSELASAQNSYYGVQESIAYNQGRLDDAKTQLTAAQNAIDQGIAPQDIPLSSTVDA